MKKILIIICIAIFTSCNIFKPSESSEVEKLIIFQTTNCSVQCPVYKMVIYSDGKVVYEGKDNIEKLGIYGRLLPLSEINELISLFTDADFFNLKDEYLGISQTQPTIFTTFNYEGKHKRVKNHTGGPEKLVIIENKLQEIVNSGEWIQVP